MVRALKETPPMHSDVKPDKLLTKKEIEDLRLRRADAWAISQARLPLAAPSLTL
jgi:hypothetical protein